MPSSRFVRDLHCLCAGGARFCAPAMLPVPHQGAGAALPAFHQQPQPLAAPQQAGHAAEGEIQTTDEQGQQQAGAAAQGHGGCSPKAASPSPSGSSLQAAEAPGGGRPAAARPSPGAAAAAAAGSHAEPQGKPPAAGSSKQRKNKVVRSKEEFMEVRAGGQAARPVLCCFTLRGPRAGLGRAALAAVPRFRPACRPKPSPLGPPACPSLALPQVWKRFMKSRQLDASVSGRVYTAAALAAARWRPPSHCPTLNPRPPRPNHASCSPSSSIGRHLTSSSCSAS